MKSLAASAALLGLVFAGSSVAHHSTNLGYDVTKRNTITGEFVDFKWINPHAILRISVTNADGEREIWVAETHGASVLGRFGWRPQMFEPGQMLTLMGNPARKTGANFIHMLSATTEDGATYTVNEPND